MASNAMQPLMTTEVFESTEWDDEVLLAIEEAEKAHATKLNKRRPDHFHEIVVVDEEEDRDDSAKT